MHAIPLLDSQLSRELICNISNNAVNVVPNISLDRTGYVVGNTAEERSDRGGSWRGAG